MKPSCAHIVIVGAGVAGAASAHALATQGWRVRVHEAAGQTAAAASAVPLALFAPSTSADDAVYSRRLRQGVHLLLAQLQRLTQAGLLQEGEDWQRSGVQERCWLSPKRLPAQWGEPPDPPEWQSRILQAAASDPRAASTLLNATFEIAAQTTSKTTSKATSSAAAGVLWHGAAGWLCPASLVRAWLQHPHIELILQSPLSADRLHAWMRSPDVRAVILCTGAATDGLLQTLVPEHTARLLALRGQVEYGTNAALQACLQAFNTVGSAADNAAIDAAAMTGLLQHPINGMGHWLGQKRLWLTGSTFQRHDTDTRTRAQDRQKNTDQLSRLLPEMPAAFWQNLLSQAQSWAGVRCAQPSRQPWVGRPFESRYSKLWVCAGLGARGLTWGPWCAQVLASQIGGTPR